MSNIRAWAFLLLISCIIFIVAATSIQSIIRSNALASLQEEAARITAIQAQSLKSELIKFELLPELLSENPYLSDAMTTLSDTNQEQLNLKLKDLVEQTGATYIFAVDPDGKTIASSNFDLDESFVGRSYAFRPYFKNALLTGSGRYFAEGERTGKPGLFLSTRVDKNASPIGVIVVKVEFETLIRSWTEQTASTFAVDPDGIILFSSDPALEFTTTRALSPEREAQIEAAQQFGDMKLTASGLDLSQANNPKVHHKAGINLTSFAIEELDWTLYRAQEIEPSLREATARIQFLWLLAAVLLTGAVLFVVRRYREAQANATYLARLEKDVSTRTEELTLSKQRLEAEVHENELVNAKYRSAREELAQANRLGSIGAITASVAHEVNQPLAAIRAFAENSKKFLERGQTVNLNDNLGSIIGLTDRLAAITSELRRYSRRGSRGIENVALSDVFDGVNLLIADRIRNAGVALDIPFAAAEGITVRAGPVRLEQVFVNLLQNAFDAVENQDRREIAIHVHPEPSHVDVIIEDNGPGVTADLADDIFNPFVTSKKDGLGIGLGIARDIMHEFGGHLEFIPILKLGGAAFRIRLVRK